MHKEDVDNHRHYIVVDGTNLEKPILCSRPKLTLHRTTCRLELHKSTSEERSHDERGRNGGEATRLHITSSQQSTLNNDKLLHINSLNSLSIYSPSLQSHIKQAFERQMLGRQVAALSH